MLIMMKRDWAYDLIPGSTRRTLPKGLPFDVAPEVANQAIAEGAAERVVVAFADTAADLAEDTDVVDGSNGNEGEGAGEGDDAGEDEGSDGADQATAPAAAVAPTASRSRKTAAVPAPADPVEPA